MQDKHYGFIHEHHIAVEATIPQTIVARSTLRITRWVKAICEKSITNKKYKSLQNQKRTVQQYEFHLSTIFKESRYHND